MAEGRQGSVGRITQLPVVCSRKALQSSRDVLTEIETRAKDGEIDQYDLVCILRKARQAIKDDELTVMTAEQSDGQIELAQHFTRAVTDVKNTVNKLEKNGIRVMGRREREKPLSAA